MKGEEIGKKQHKNIQQSVFTFDFVPERPERPKSTAHGEEEGGKGREGQCEHGASVVDLG